MRRFLSFACFAAVGLTSLISAQTKYSVVSGRVTVGDGQPMIGVNVFVVGSFHGGVSDADGRFSFKTNRLGAQKIQAKFIGYETAERTIRLAAGDTVFVEFSLKKTLLMLEEAVVTASAFTTGDQKGVTLGSMDVVTTPGAAADVFLAIKTFPGVAMVDEGSGLFVRGGDVTETVTLLDQATVAHPYKYESPTGGVFGTISPFLVKGTFFSSGGFSAKYGNALSGVLAMESEDMPERTEYTLGVGLAAGSAGLNTKLANDKFGLRFSGNRSSTSAMFRLNGRRNDFTTTPKGVDGNLSLIYRYSPSGQIKFFNFGSNSHLGVRVAQPSFDGIFESEENNALHNIQWREIFSGWLAKTSLSLNRFESQTKFGNLDLDQRDRTAKLRLDLEKELAEKLNLVTGFEIERVSNRFTGETPFYNDVLDENALVYSFDEDYATVRPGAWVESDVQVNRRIFAKLGLRADYHNLAEQTILDPRFSLRYQMTKSRNVRFSWGRYQQFPGAFLFNAESGNPNLRAQRAEHRIVTFEQNFKHGQLRVEAYDKKYDGLALRHSDLNYANIGDGYSRGLDFFLRYGAFLQTPVDGWISYSFLRSERRLVRDEAGDFFYENARSNFDITHNLTVVAKTRIWETLSFGATWRYATGRPVTPIIAAELQQPENFYLPIEGPVNSERLPGFQRLDLNLSYYQSFGYGNAFIFYVALSNALNRKNILAYDYSFDYSTRTPRETNYQRFVYFGFTVTILN